MQVSKSGYTPNFGRAFTTQEKQDYKHLIKESRKELGLRDTSAIIFDFNTPSEKDYNLGIGTSFSDSMQKFTDFLVDMTGITSVQLGPQGKITYANKSPYSGTNYALGEHIIDTKKLTRIDDYARILFDDDVKKAHINYFGDKQKREYWTDYDHVIGTENVVGLQEKLLRKAYKNFIYLMSVYDKNAAKLNADLQKFKEANKNWLEPETMFAALTEEYGTDDFNQWLEEDCNLYSSNTSKSARQARINELKEQYRETVEFENFKQFLADKQQQESKLQLKAKGIKLYGDCLLGFSKSEIWANIDCFNENLFYGGPDPNCPETNGIQTWGLNALDYTKLGEIGDDGDMSNLGPTGKMLYKKYSQFFKRYDGLRMDAAWQFVTPFVYKEENGSFKEVKMPEIKDTVLKIVGRAAKDTLGRNFDSYNPNNIMLELVGLSADKAKEMTKNKYPMLFTTAYAEYGESPAQFSKAGYKRNKFYVGVGNHDNETLVQQSRNEERRNLHLKGIMQDYNTQEDKLGFSSPEYLNQNDEEKEQENFRTAKFSEIFTTAKQFFTLPDMFGMTERINISGKQSNENWRVRIPTDYEKFYFSQLSKGYGLNVPKALENAIYMRNIDNPYITEKLNEAGEILRQNGPLTEQEANIADKNGELKNKFRFYI